MKNSATAPAFHDASRNILTTGANTQIISPQTGTPTGLPDLVRNLARENRARTGQIATTSLNPLDQRDAGTQLIQDTRGNRLLESEVNRIKDQSEKHQFYDTHRNLMQSQISTSIDDAILRSSETDQVVLNKLKESLSTGVPFELPAFNVARMSDEVRGLVRATQSVQEYGGDTRNLARIQGDTQYQSTTQGQRITALLQDRLNKKTNKISKAMRSPQENRIAALTERDDALSADARDYLNRGVTDSDVERQYSLRPQVVKRAAELTRLDRLSGSTNDVPLSVQERIQKEDERDAQKDYARRVQMLGPTRDKHIRAMLSRGAFDKEKRLGWARDHVGKYRPGTKDRNTEQERKMARQMLQAAGEKGKGKEIFISVLKFFSAMLGILTAELGVLKGLYSVTEKIVDLINKYGQQAALRNMNNLALNIDKRTLEKYESFRAFTATRGNAVDYTGSNQSVSNLTGALILGGKEAVEKFVKGSVFLSQAAGMGDKGLDLGLARIVANEGNTQQITDWHMATFLKAITSENGMSLYSDKTKLQELLSYLEEMGVGSQQGAAFYEAIMSQPELLPTIRNILDGFTGGDVGTTITDIMDLLNPA
jgi:hypothetical protein